MSNGLDFLNQLAEELESSVVGYETDLRLDLAEFIWNGLAKSGWSQRELAAESGLPDAIISNLIHGNKNCTLRTIARVAHALKSRATIGLPSDANLPLLAGPATVTDRIESRIEWDKHGYEEKVSFKKTEGPYRFSGKDALKGITSSGARTPIAA